MSARPNPPPVRRPRWRRDLTVRMPRADVAMSLAAPPPPPSSSLDTKVEPPLAEMELINFRRRFTFMSCSCDPVRVIAIDPQEAAAAARSTGSSCSSTCAAGLSPAAASRTSALAGVACQALSEIAHLHRRGVVHGDIRPSNLFVDSSGRVKIAGFGADHAIDRTANGGPCRASFSPAAYMSPDHAGGGYAGDIWSFGLTILELYTGSFPLVEQGQSIPLTCYSDGPPEAPATASPEFRSFVGCCLQMNPAKRPSAVQLMDHPFVTSSVFSQE
uniref:Protein kinase domain-containing protein n=1 Tax=Oryza barthii TaxID=65489 RepID=A0A0D3GDP7_9ORYZ